MSSTSPAKCSPEHTRLSIVLKSTSANFTPPHVTNSSLNKLFPTTFNSAAVSCVASVLSAVLPTWAHTVVAAIPDETTSRSHSRCGIASGLHVAICFLGFLSRTANSSFTSDSRVGVPVQFTVNKNS